MGSGRHQSSLHSEFPQPPAGRARAALALLIPIAWISERVNGGSLRAAEWARAKIDELSR